MSARYQDNEGIVDNTANKTYSVRANIEANPTQWLTLGTRTYASQMDRVETVVAFEAIIPCKFI